MSLFAFSRVTALYLSGTKIFVMHMAKMCVEHAHFLQYYQEPTLLPNTVINTVATYW